MLLGSTTLCMPSGYNHNLRIAMLTVGLTGGIGSGKTTVANLFKDLGTPVLDADIITRELVEPGQPALTEITSHFGASILNPDGTLNRTALRDRVFDDSDGRKALETILHPRVRDCFTHRLKALDAHYAILVIPLLFESGQNDLIQRALVIDCEESEQINRVVIRDEIPRQQIESIMAAQWTRQQRLAAADDVIVNDADLRDLRQQVQKLHQKYLGLCQ